MTDFTSPGHARTLLALPSIAPSRRRRAALVLGTAGAVALAFAWSTTTLEHSMEWQLALLLRFMAALKAAMALGAFALAVWRFGSPLTAGFALAYGCGVAGMAAAPVLIAALSHVALAAVGFHAGLLVFLLAALRDDAPGRLWASRKAAVR